MQRHMCADIGIILTSRPLDKQQPALETTYDGCYLEDTAGVRDFPFRMWDRTDNTIQGCIQTCRNRGFQYAGLQV